MRKTVWKVLSFFLVTTILLGGISTASAAVEETVAPCASAYYNNYGCSITPLGGGDLQIRINVTATHAMTKLGATSIVLYEKLPEAFGYSSVHTYNLNTAPTVMGYGVTAHTFRDTYTKGVVGAQFYVSVAFYAEDSQGSEIKYISSPVITAT